MSTYDDEAIKHGWPSHKRPDFIEGGSMSSHIRNARTNFLSCERIYKGSRTYENYKDLVKAKKEYEETVKRQLSLIINDDYELHSSMVYYYGA